MRKHLLTITLISLFWSSQSEAQVTADFSTSDTIVCGGKLTRFTYTGQDAKLFHWDFGDGTVSQSTTNPIKTKNYSRPGTYLVKLVATDSVTSDTVTQFIRVRQLIDMSFSLNESTSTGYYCLGSNLSISEWSTIQGFDSIFWDVGDGYMSNELYPNHTYTTPGQYQLKLRLKGYCGEDEDSISVGIADDERGKANTSLSAYPNTICPGEMINISVWAGSTPPDSTRVYLGDGNSTMLDEFDYT